MASTEALKEIYERINPELSFCMFAPNLDKDKWEKVLNSIAPREEPLSVLCIGEANSKGILSTFSAGQFLFSHEKLYLKKSEGIKYSDIESISYLEEMKNSLFGFGKEKAEGHIIVKFENGQTMTFKGNYATNAIADFLNKAVCELKKNPPEPLPEIDSSHADEIANKIKEFFADDLIGWHFKPNIPEDGLNSTIIRYMENDYKSSCSAYYYDNPSASNSQKICFFNDKMFACTYNHHYIVRYKDLASAICEENVSEYYGNTIKKIILCDKNNNHLLESSYMASEKGAKFIEWLISKETGRETKIDYKTPAMKESELNKKAIEEGGILKYNSETENYITSSTEDYETFTNLLKKWNEIFKQNEQWEFKELNATSSGKTTEYTADKKNLTYSRFKFSPNHFSFTYSPEPEKTLTLLYNDNYCPDTHDLQIVVEMKSKDFSFKFRTRDVRVFYGGSRIRKIYINPDMISECCGIPDFSANIKKFREKLETIDKKHADEQYEIWEKQEEKRLADLKKIEDSHRNDFADW